MHELFDMFIEFRHTPYVWIPFGFLSLIGTISLWSGLISKTPPEEEFAQRWALAMLVLASFVGLLFWLSDVMARDIYWMFSLGGGSRKFFAIVVVFVATVAVPAGGTYVLIKWAASLFRRHRS